MECKNHARHSIWATSQMTQDKRRMDFLVFNIISQLKSNHQYKAGSLISEHWWCIVGKK